MKSSVRLLVLGTVAFTLAADPRAATGPPRPPPVAKREPHPTTLHGEPSSTTTSGCARRTTRRSRAYLEAENAYTDAVMEPTEAAAGDALQGDARPHQGDRPLVPVRDGGYFYYSRTEEGKQYPIHCRKKGSLDAPEEVIARPQRAGQGPEVHRARRLRASATTATCSPTPPTPPASASTRCTSRTCATGKLLPEQPARRSTRSPGPPTTRRSSTRPRTPPSGRTGSTATRSATERRTTRCSTRRRTSASTSASTARAAGAYLFLDIEQPHHLRGALPARRRARRRVAADRAARAGPRVRRRPPRRRSSTSAPTTPGRNFRLVTRAGRPTRGARTGRSRPAPRRRDARGRRPLRATTTVLLERQDGLPPAPGRRPRSGAAVAPDRASRSRPTPSFPADNPEFDTPTLPLHLPVARDAARRSSTTTSTRRKTHAAEAAPRCSAATTHALRHRAAATPRRPTARKVPISLVYRKGVEARRHAPAAALRLRLLRHLRCTSTFSSNRVSLLDRGVVYRHRPHPRRRRAGQALARRRAA